MLGLHDAKADPTSEIVSCGLEGPLGVDSASRGELDLCVQVAAGALDRELPATGRVGLLGLGGLSHRYASDSEKVAERMGSKRIVDPGFDIVETRSQVVEVDILGAPATLVEEPKVGSSLYGVVSDWKVRGKNLEESQVKQLDQLCAFALVVHGAKTTPLIRYGSMSRSLGRLSGV